MNLRYNPFPLIFARGDAATKLACLQFFELEDSLRAKEHILNLIEEQRSDGAFPSLLNPAKWGMVETVRNTLYLLNAGLPSEGVNISSAVKFILNHQNPDGGWCENSSLEIPEERVELSSQQSVTWLTADIVDLLCKVGIRGCKECRAALEWLRKMQNQHGGWHCFSGSIGDRLKTRGDPDSTAQITFLMGEVYGEDDPTYLKGRELFESYLDEYTGDIERGYWIRLRDGRREELDVYHLTHLLLSSLVDSPRRFESGYDVNDPMVKRMMEALIDIQLEDGGWRPFWAQGSSPVYTVLAVKVLVLSRAVSREDMRDVERWVN